MATIRVLHILHSMNRGGAENAIMNYYRHINRERVQFDFLLTEPSKCSFEDEIERLGGKVFRVPRLDLLRPWNYIRSVRRFFYNHPEYKIVHSHTSSKSFIPLLIAKASGIPIRISHSHGSRTEKGLKGLLRNVLKIPLKIVANHYFACGEDAAKWLFGEAAFSKGKVVIIPNVIECTRFDFNQHRREELRSKIGVQEDSIIVGCTARFSAVKNHYFLLACFERLHKSFPDSLLLLIGDGELHDSIVEKVHDYHLDDSVIMTGVVSNVNDYEQAMDFFIMPSFFEGLPLSLIEAQISGLKCFVSDGVPKEADKTGLVSFLPLNSGPEYWAHAIVEAIGYPRESRIEDIRKAGYDAEISASKLETLYTYYYLQLNEN